jgi:hypothetical protein
LHHVFDEWMSREYPGCPFERYADDVVIHCSSHEQALAVKAAVEARLRRCKLEAHPDKTRIVYCRDSNRSDDHDSIQFDFLGYRFRPRRAMNRHGKVFTGFLPAISAKAEQAIAAEIRRWGLSRRSDLELDEMARACNQQIRGWIGYYGRFYPTALHRTFRPLNRRLVRWAQRKYKRFRDHQEQAWTWLRRMSRSKPSPFVHWAAGFVS